MKYATLDKNNQPNAFYSDDIHGPRYIPDTTFVPSKIQKTAPNVLNPKTQIPANAVGIPENVWNKHINGTIQTYNVTKKTWSTYIPPKAKVLETAKLIKMGELKQAYETLVNTTVQVNGAAFDANDANDANDASKTRIDRVIGRLTSGWTPPLHNKMYGMTRQINHTL